jgi:small subunit ribosomal protein S17
MADTATKKAPAATSASDSPDSHGGRRIEVGIVTSDVRQKTIKVEIKHLVKHARYGKYIFRSTNLHAHDEKNEAKKGDRVEIVETRPLSKQKRWRLVKIIERAAVLGQLEIKEVEEVAPKKHETAPVAAEETAEAKV